ncbi:MAG TPA: AAA family ATPase [Solirubrobacteraceae bacterium]|nr:AAA family ATPase [Solirubrobacteraceae bacterium]
MWVDVEAAAQAVEAARAAGLQARWSVAREHAEAAVELLRPGLLPAQDGEWLQAARWEHEELLLEALESAARSGVALGATGAAGAERASRELIARSPFRESGYRFLIEALAARGNVAEAMRVYERLRVLLRDELGVAPAADLQALHLRLLSGEMAESAPASPVDAAPAGPPPLPSPLSVTSPLPFAGRSGELEALRRLMEWGEEAAARAVLIGGEAGAGKSRLVREFAREAAAGGALVAHGACDVMVRPPYGPFVEALDHLLRVTGAAELREGLGPAAGELVRLLPGLRDAVGEPAAPVDADPDTERHRLHTAVADLLTASGRKRPLVLVIEDAQWADVSSLSLLRHLVRTGGGARVLLVVTFRDTAAEMPEALSETLADLRRSEGVVRLPLGRLSGEEVGHFVRRAAGVAGGAAELTDAIGGLTGGHPFLVCELWRTLVDSEVMDVAGGSIRLRRPLSELGVPDSVREVAGRRAAHLGPETRAVLELAATAGAELDVAALHRPAEPPPVAALEEAVRAVRDAGLGLVSTLTSGRTRWPCAAASG